MGASGVRPSTSGHLAPNRGGRLGRPEVKGSSGRWPWVRWSEASVCLCVCVARGGVRKRAAPTTVTHRDREEAKRLGREEGESRISGWRRRRLSLLFLQPPLFPASPRSLAPS